MSFKGGFFSKCLNEPTSKMDWNWLTKMSQALIYTGGSNYVQPEQRLYQNT